MKLRLCFFMLALGICGAVVQGCDDNDDNLDVLDKLQAAFSQKYPEASPKWKTRSNYYGYAADRKTDGTSRTSRKRPRLLSAPRTGKKLSRATAGTVHQQQEPGQSLPV